VSSSTTKRVLLERFDREPLKGFANPQTMLQAGGIELMRPDGSVAMIPYEQVKAVCFVRDLEGGGVFGERRQYATRPKSTGLWMGLEFRDGDRLEGIIPNNLLQLDAQGFSLSPPEATGNTQRVFVPRQALREIVVLGVIGTPKPPGRRPKPVAPEQIRLFSEDSTAEAGAR
jgi:hypothetical protein